jgi:hypothetical protein
MSYTLKVNEQPGYLHFQVIGSNSLATVRGYLGEIHATCVQRQLSAILIEENLGGPGLGIGEIFQVASAGSEATAPVIRTIAYVDTNPDHDFLDMQFAETVAVTRGIDIRVFESLAAAETWLRQRVGPM